jgi:hypothetical protein
MQLLASANRLSRLGVLGTLLLASCNREIASPIPAEPTATATSTPLFVTIVSATPIPSSTPSQVPTFPLERLKNKMPSTTPADGFVVLDMPQIVYWDARITVTIMTVPGTDCLIWYYGTDGLSHAKGLQSEVADANGICSWTWRQAEVLGGKDEDILPFTAKISIIAGGTWSDYDLVVK